MRRPIPWRAYGTALLWGWVLAAILGVLLYGMLAVTGHRIAIGPTALSWVVGTVRGTPLFIVEAWLLHRAGWL